MNKKLLCVISAILVALSLCFFASCDGCNGGGKTGELKSSMGVTLTGGNFGEKAKLITEKVEMTEENVKSTIDKLPEEFKLLADEKMTTIDISVESGGVKVQPDGKVRVSVPAPIEGVEEYMVFHIKSESKVERLDCEFKDGNVVFETDSFSPFVFLDNSDSSELVIKNPGPCEGTVTVTYFMGVVTTWYKIYSGEEKKIYSRANETVKLFVECGYDFVLDGWFMEKDGKIESTPFSTESMIEGKTVAGKTTIVCKFAADLTNMESVWAFPGTSNMPKREKFIALGRFFDRYETYVKSEYYKKQNKSVGYKSGLFGRSCVTPILYDIAGKSGERDERSGRITRTVSHYHLHRHSFSDRSSYTEYDSRNYAAFRCGKKDLPHRLIFIRAESQSAFVIVRRNRFETVFRDGSYSRQNHHRQN